MRRRTHEDLTLHDLYDYQRVDNIKRALRHYHLLEECARRGDSIAAAIMVDVKTALGCYESDQWHRVLTDRQAVVIQRYYVEGYRMTEIADDLGITQAAVSQLVYGGTKAIYVYLSTGKTGRLNWRPDELALLLSQPDTDRAELARQLGRTVTAVAMMQSRLRRGGDGHEAPTRAKERA